ncbi:MAG: low molecular weight protein arginine phosphatase [Candidatus Lokiarchaeota archaeon]|nr:low molecular weight protein arginine phosphatase [Candidatus Lokiarchaeota archaeon]
MTSKFPYKSILIVCSVNTARSPMAEGFLKDFFSKNNLDIEVKSGGISSHARDGMLISMDSKLAMKEIGIILSDTSMSVDLKKHTHLIEKADLILTLTDKHRKEINNFLKTNNKKICTIKEFGGRKGDIEDPSMKEELFSKVRDEIIDNLTEGLNKYSF